MFLALDESMQGSKKVLGGVLLPQDDLPDFEAAFVRLRVQHKLFGEICWEQIDQNYRKYCDFIDLFFSRPAATFHSTSFVEDNKQYRSGYVLIRAITWKLWNHGIRRPLMILFDANGNFGRRELEITRRLLASDTRVKTPIEFCNQGTSHVLGVLQIADLITGAVCAEKNNVLRDVRKKNVVDHIRHQNGGIPLDFVSAVFPKLRQYKMHHYDPGSIRASLPK